MKLTGKYAFNAPQEIVWDALFDPEILKRIMPGCEKLEQTDDNQYESVLKIKVGPVQGKFTGNIALSDIQKPDSYHMSVSGKGNAGHMTGEADVRLEMVDEQTVIHYSMDAKVGGRLASVGQRLMTSSAKSLAKNSLQNLEKQIDAKVAALNAPPEPEPEPQSATPAETSQPQANGSAPKPEQPKPQPRQAPQPPPSYTPPPPPSQTDFAKGVAKDILDDLIPPEKQPMVAIGLLVTLLVLWWLTRSPKHKS